MLQDLRQLIYPKEFRIGSMSSIVADIELDELVSGLSALFAPEGESDDRDVIGPIAIAAWRLEKRMKKLDDHMQRTRLKPILMGLQDVLEKKEVRIVDFTGQIYNPDENWDKVIGAPVSDGEVYVHDMGSPRIFYKGVMIQGGSVIVKKKES